MNTASTTLTENASAASTSALEIWGGVECTRNRVRNRYLDQAAFSGHDRRNDDYARIAALGIRTCRVGLLWERHEEHPDWSREDAQLAQLRDAGIRPIAGLMHHGSGPPDTSLLDPHYPQRLANYAAAVARRYPWLDAYTPVNEPNTTARFSGMYGLWYPHQRSRPSYVRALLNQMRATVLSMQAIRRVRPEAQLIQTEDGGRITGTPQLSATVDLLNERRWLTFDLLCGRVTHGHPLYSWIRQRGATESELDWFTQNPCPPHVVGLNYYVTSDRYLDHRLHLYPANRRSAEGRFVDVDLVRMQGHTIAGFSGMLRDAWQRYHLPLALTEVHIGCTVEEQIRWVAEAWHATQQARAEGIDCRALTLWALLGSYHWNTLVTRTNGAYEQGVFNVSHGAPARTQLADVVEQMTAGVAPSHPSLWQRGWWRQPDRFHYPQTEFADLAA